MEFSRELMACFVPPQDSVGSYSQLTTVSKGTLLNLHPSWNKLIAVNLTVNIEAAGRRWEGQ
jgi:hypothetical protein